MQTIYILATNQVVQAAETYIHPNDGGPHSNEVYGGTDFVDADKLAEIGAVPYREEGPPEGMQATEWSEGLEEGVWVRRAVTWEELPAPTLCPRMTLTVAEFMQRFTAIEFQSYALSADQEIAVLRVEVSTYTGIDLDSPRLSDGLDLLISKGIISAERKAELLIPAEGDCCVPLYQS